MPSIYTKSGMLICTDFNRIVHGERGDYIEFTKKQVIWDNIYIPYDQKWRLSWNKCYYIEYRTKKDNVKIYLQKSPVKYADYKIGMFYVSPKDIKGKINLLSFI